MAPESIYFGLNAIGDITEIDRSNSIAAGPNQSGPAYSVLSYNTQGQLTGINHQYMGASLDNLTYSYDSLGRVSTFGSVDGTASYGYDKTSQLISASYTSAAGHTEPPNFAIAFDPNGNRSLVNGASTTISSNNEVTNDGTFTYQFDPEGNRTVRTRISTAYAADYRTTYAWDYRNRLTDVENFDNNGVLTSHVHYVYDVWDHLIERDVDPNGSGSYTQIVHYVWDATTPPTLGDGGQPPSAPGNIVLAFNGQQQLTTRYLNGPNTSAYDQFFNTLAEEDVGNVNAPGTVYYYLLDDQGSLTDEVGSNGALANHITYAAYGQDFAETNPSLGHLTGFEGGLYDSLTQLVNNVERWYDPLATVWITSDPTGFASGDTNTSRYVSNDPANMSDRTGEYGRAGHFWTSFIVARAAGYTPSDAYRIAYNSQLPDQSEKLDAHTLWNESFDPTQDRVWLMNVFNYLHSLHGGNEAAVNCRRQVLSKLISESRFPTGWETGFLIHALGDAYAHTFVHPSGHVNAFGYPDGHGNDSAAVRLKFGWLLGIKDPDSIATDPAKYREYVNVLFDALAKANGGKPVNRALLQNLLDQSGGLPSSEKDAINMLKVLARSAGYNKQYDPTDQFNTDYAFREPSRAEMNKWFVKLRKACNAASQEE